MKVYLTAFYYEYRNAMRRYFRYKISFISDSVLFLLLFLGIFFSSDGGYLTQSYGVSSENGKILMLLGYAFWQLSSISLGISAGVIKSEAISGTLEMKILGKVPVIFLLFARLLAGIIIGIISLFVVVFVAVLLCWISISDGIYFIKAFFIYLPSLLGMFGIGLIIGSIVLKEKNIGQFLFIIQTALLFVSNIFGINSSKIINIVPYIYGTS